MCGMSKQFPTKLSIIARIQSLSYAKKLFFFTLTFVISIVRTCKTSDCLACLHVAACHRSWRQGDWGESKKHLPWLTTFACKRCTRMPLHCTAATFHSVSFSKPNPVWFGKKKIDFERRRFQTKFRLVWKILMTIVNVLKIPNQIQFGLEKLLTNAKALVWFGKVIVLRFTNILIYSSSPSLAFISAI